MWIETEINEIKPGTKNRKIVIFSAQGADGKPLGAQEYAVQQGIGMKPSIGLAVRIQVNGTRVVKVELHRKKATMLPYGFVPINLRHAVTDTPVLHDGSSGGELLSGEILCELEALTPLLPGNARYPVKQASQQRLQQWGFDKLSEDKQIAEPLRLADGRVVIAGSALKGMIRHSLSILTAAPMERVGERHFTYRPNLDFNKGDKERYVVRPALVIAERDGGWEIEVFDNAQAALFVRQDATLIIHKNAANGVIEGQITGISVEIKYPKNKPPKETNHLIPSEGFTNFDHRLANYKGGIDGEGLLAAAFTPPTCTYQLALVPRKVDYRLHLPAELYRQYLHDQHKVLSDDKIGHLTAHPHSKNFKVDQVAAAIRQHAEFSPNQLIYVELSTDSQGKVTTQSKVVSCGHHFRYRWAYTSSIRKRNDQLRTCLTPQADEQLSPEQKDKTDAAPKQLTGARLLFGYVHDKDTNPIGKGTFERLAGRIAINHAVSASKPRFLGDPDKGYCIPLKILGQPKPSAWEFYLKQPDNPRNAPNTYGDLPGDAGGELAGRKFYRHQPDTNPADIEAAADAMQSDQATLARFICQAETRFRFTIRFARLRPWELGALLAVLEPQRLAPSADEKQYAHKLGLGRPLGMGSVRITRQAIRLRREKDTTFMQAPEAEEINTTALEALRTKLKSAQIDAWLQAHGFTDGQRLAYPQHQQKQTIYDWHTDIRRQYSQLRRQKAPDWSGLINTIRSKN